MTDSLREILNDDARQRRLAFLRDLVHSNNDKRMINQIENFPYCLFPVKITAWGRYGRIEE